MKTTAILLTVALSACAGTVNVISESPSHIVVNRDPLIGSIDEANRRANDHCRTFGKVAQYRGETYAAGGWLAMRFVCE